MIDMKETIIPKSDQLNADDLIAGTTKTITVTEVSVRPGAEQPCTIRFEGDNGKPYKPCKSMCRVLIMIWGDDGEKYVGQAMTLYCDPNVKWGGAAVGGIRITHMSGLKEKRTMSLTVTRGNKKPYSVEPLAIMDTKPTGHPIADADWQSWVQKMDSAATIEEMGAIGKEIGQVSGNYDQASVSKLKAYYADRQNTINAFPQ